MFTTEDMKKYHTTAERILNTVIIICLSLRQGVKVDLANVEVDSDVAAAQIESALTRHIRAKRRCRLKQRRKWLIFYCLEIRVWAIT